MTTSTKERNATYASLSALFRGTEASLAANRGYPVLELIRCFLSELGNHSEEADEKFGDHEAAEDRLIRLDVSAVPA